MEKDITLKIDTQVETKEAETGLTQFVALVKSIMANVSSMITSIAKKVKGITKLLDLSSTVAALGKSIANAMDFSAGNKMVAQFCRVIEAFENNFALLKEAVERTIMPIAKILMTTGSSIIEFLTTVSNSVSSIMGQLFGSMNDYATESEKAAGGQNKLAKATLSAGKAAKSTLAAFDRLNVLSISGGSGGGGGGKPPKPPKPPKPEQPEEKPEIPGLEALKNVLEAISGVIERLKPLGQWLWESFLVPLGAWAWDMVITGLEGIANCFAGISLWIDENKIKLMELWATIEPLITRIGEVFWGLLEGITTYFAEWCAAFTENLTAVMDIWVAIITGDWAKAWDAIKGIFATNKAILLTGLGVLWEGMKGGFLLALDTIKDMWAPVGAWFNEKVIVPLRRSFGWLWEGISTAAKISWQMMLGIWEPLSAWFSEKVAAPVAAVVKELWNDMAGFFQVGLNAVSDAIKGYVNFCIDMGESGANVLINIFNNIIDGLNTISVDIPKWVPKYGGNSFGINIPNIPEISIPRLATGAVIPPNAQFAAILGDQKNGRNLEAPEGLIRNIVREESGAREIVIRFDGEMAQLVRLLKPALEQEKARQGARLIVGGV